MATDLGKVGIRMRGTWDSSTAYEVLDAVSYNNGLYIAKQAVPANTLPTNATYWQAALVQTSESYSLANIELKYESTGATQPTYTLNTSSSITRSGSTVTLFLLFSVTDVGSGSSFAVTGLPVLPKGQRVGGIYFGGAINGCFGLQVRKDNGTLMPWKANGQRIASTDLSIGTLAFSATFGIE